jgi:4-alpha-glucanotransferase
MGRLGTLIDASYEKRFPNQADRTDSGRLLKDNKEPLFDWLSVRGAGVLLHPTSFPSAGKVGVFDGAAERFLDFLQAAGMSHWQLCPLGPTGYGDSPYQCFSAFAGNPYLIDLADLAARGLFDTSDLAAPARAASDRVDFGSLYREKWPQLRKAFDRYKSAGEPVWDGEDFAGFKARQSPWLDAYAYFRALKDHNGGRAWTEWPAGLRDSAAAFRSPLRLRLAREIEAHQFYQYIFFSQWRRLRAAAGLRGISVIGDLPIFVAADSADVWANPGLFELDPGTGAPAAVAGVPPDYFTADGQLWGNPLYAWERHAADGYAWWRERLRASFELYDVVRIDHFRGFDEYWRIPQPAATAREGAWRPGPGLGLFRAIRDSVPHAKIIAEDLGVLTPGVVKLREETGLPGMAVLQFAFGDDALNPYLPHNLVPNSTIYTGTHDNDTSLGWYASADEPTRDHARRYLRSSGAGIGWDLIRTAYASVSRLAVIPLQDIMSLGSEGRFNTPGKSQGNWQWRYHPSQLDRLGDGTAAYLRELADLCGRLKKPPVAK